jgi:hypothetical protein
MTKQNTLGVGMVATGIAVAVAAFLLFASQAFAAGTVSVTSGEVPAGGGSVTVALQGDAGSAEIGSYNVEVAFDPTDFTGNPTFSSNAAGDCSFPSSGVLRCAGAAGSAGVQGDLATITFTTTASFTDCTDLVVTVNDFNDASEGNPLNPTASNGEICVAAATPTAAPTSPGASPTATTVQPSKAPNTGGTPSDGSVSTATWLLGIAGLMIVAAGAWTLSRARREI